MLTQSELMPRTNLGSVSRSGMGMFSRVATVILMTLAVATVGRLSFFDPIQQALADGGWVAFTGAIISLSASIIGVAGAVYSTCKN
jgi:hypothetical protein